MSSSPIDFGQLITLFLPQVPLVVVWLMGIVVALSNLKRHPRPAALMLIALVLLLGQAVFGTLAWFWLLNQQATGSAAQFSMYTGVLRLTSAFLSTVAWALVLVAVFSGRPYAYRFGPDEEPLPVRRPELRRPPAEAPPSAFREQPPSP
jgi:hypothetical protein